MMHNDRPSAPVAIRLSFVDDKSGNPVIGLVVRALAEPPAVACSAAGVPARQTGRAQIAMLQTDLTGYVSFKLDPATVAASPQLTFAYGPSDGQAAVFSAADLLAGINPHTIRVDTASIPPGPPHLAVPSLMLPDAQDQLASPGSIGTMAKLLPDSSVCAQLLPTTIAARRFRAFHVLADICHPEVMHCATDVSVVRGKMFEYEIVWNPAGAALGELLNTISLAPCEQVNISVADWMRRETASQTSVTNVQQDLTQRMDHDRLINESMRNTLDTSNSSSAIGGAIGANIPVHGVDITAAFGGAVASGSTTSDLVASMTSKLCDTVKQSASFVASQRSTVVFQTTASEEQTYQTRTVRNNNHCHTLNLMYYQVNTNYNVVTTFKGTRGVVLVKYDNADFDAKRAYCSAGILKSALLDPTLKNCFDELADALFCCTAPAPTPADGRKIDSVTLTFRIDRSLGQAFFLEGSLALPNGTVSMPPISTYNQGSGTVLSVTVNLPVPIDPSQALSISLTLIVGHMGGILEHETTSLVINNLLVTGHVAGSNTPLQLYSLTTNTTFNKDQLTWSAPLSAPPPQPTAAKGDCIENSCAAQKLLGHLNCHKRYYNSLLWLAGDPNERVTQWSCCNQTDQSQSLIMQIVNDPLTVYGDYVVFPAAGGQLVDDPKTPPVSTLITMPTPGVYSEGILGQCTTCEPIDDSVFWDWKSSPCPDNAPALTAPPAPQASVRPGDLKADAISNLITLLSVPSAPDSVLKDLITSLVAKADAGSTAAQDLLGKLLDAIKAGLGKSKTAAPTSGAGGTPADPAPADPAPADATPADAEPLAGV